MSDVDPKDTRQLKATSRHPACRTFVVTIVLCILFLTGLGLDGHLRPQRPDRSGVPVESPSKPVAVVAAAEPSSGENASEAGQGSDRSEPRDARFRRLVLGTWEDDYQGKRTMTIRDDGTATMVVELDGLKAVMFASRLQFEMTWSVEEGRLVTQTLGGEPATKVNLILKMMGDRVDEPILELTEKRLLLLDADGQTKYDWRRAD